MLEHPLLGANAALCSLLLLLCILISGLFKRHRIYLLPESGAFLLLGVAVGLLLSLSPDEERAFLSFSPSLFFFVILPPIILDGGFTLHRANFFANIGTILLLAFIGTIVNNILFGLLIYGAAKAGMVPLNTDSAIESMLFGALISATDPVATLAVVGSKSVSADEHLYALILGESILNDAIAVVLFHTFQNNLLINGEPASEESSEELDAMESTLPFTAASLFSAIGNFILVSVGSVVVGLGVGALCSYLGRRFRMSAGALFNELCYIMLFAYLSYVLAEALHLSGIMSLFFCSIVLATYQYYNMTPNAQIASHESFKSLASIAETFLYIWVGLAGGLSLRQDIMIWHAGLCILTIILALICRAIHLVPLCMLANTRRSPARKIGRPMQFALWFAGLRGGVAFALCLTFPGPANKYVVAATFCLVLFTTFCGGGLTLPVLRATGMTANLGNNNKKRSSSLSGQEHHAAAALDTGAGFVDVKYPPLQDSEFGDSTSLSVQQPSDSDMMTSPPSNTALPDIDEGEGEGEGEDEASQHALQRALSETRHHPHNPSELGRGSGASRHYGPQATFGRQSSVMTAGRYEDDMGEEEESMGERSDMGVGDFPFDVDQMDSFSPSAAPPTQRHQYGDDHHEVSSPAGSSSIHFDEPVDVGVGQQPQQHRGVFDRYFERFHQLDERYFQRWLGGKLIHEEEERRHAMQHQHQHEHDHDHHVHAAPNATMSTDPSISASHVSDGDGGCYDSGIELGDINTVVASQ